MTSIKLNPCTVININIAKLVNKRKGASEGRLVSLHWLNVNSTIQLCGDRITDWRSILELELGLYLTCCDTILIRLQKSTKDVFRALAADANNSARVYVTSNHKHVSTGQVIKSNYRQYIEGVV